MTVDHPISASRDEESILPLDGITVIDLTVNIAGPSATMILADLGARIIKIEPPGGDVSRSWTPKAGGIATVYSAFNRGKESVIINAKEEEGRALLYRLLADADVFVESMRPGKADALGLGWEQLHAINPRLIYCSVNAFGEVGPMAGIAGFDAIIQAYSGIMDLTGYPDGDPARAGTAIIDVGTGIWSALGIAAALIERSKDGQGRRVPVTMLGTAVSFLMHHLTSVRLAGVVPQRLGTAQHNFAPYQAVRASDQMVMLGINTDGMWRRAAAALGNAALGDDERFATNESRMANLVALIGAIESLTSDLPANEIVSRLIGADIPASVVRTVDQLATDPQLDALELWGETEAGERFLRTPLAGARRRLGSVPLSGEHTRSVFAEQGMSEAEFDALCKRGIIGDESEQFSVAGASR